MGYSTVETHQLGNVYKQWPPFGTKICSVRLHYLFREANSFPRGALLGILIRFQGNWEGGCEAYFSTVM